MSKLFNFGMAWAKMKIAYTELIQPSIDLIETTNLFEVSMGKVTDEYGNLDEEASKYYTKAIAFQGKMNEKLATNQKEVMEYQAKYYSMFKNQGIDLDKSYLMSESLTKAGYDIASLYNLSTEQAMEKIRAGIAGQVEPLRAIGIDISESALTKVVQNAGIERSVQQLSYAEKEVARYIAIIEQAGQAQGDFAKTFESPANQIRIFKNQLEELKQVAGSFLVGVFSNVLTYVNAIIMTLKEILKSFANLFGVELNYSGTLGVVNEDLEDISNSIGGATKKAKEFKKQLMGFDEINNITLPDTSSSGSGSLATGVDDRLLKSLKEWDNKMDSISGKAQDIRDKMLDWLGFERDDDGTWKLKEGLKNLEKIKDVAINIGIAFGTWKVSSAITDLLKNLGILNENQAFQLAFGLTLSLSGIYAQYKGTKHLLNGDIDLFTILETVLGITGGTFGIVSLLNASKTGKALPLKNKIEIGAGIMLALQSVQTIVDGIKNDDMVKQIAGALEAGVGAGLITAAKGGIKVGLKMGLLFTLATIDVTLAVDIIKWWNEYFEELKGKLYGEKKELNLGEMINVGLSSVGTGVIENVIEPLFGEGAMQPIIDWTANVISTFRNLGKDIENWWEEDVAPWFTTEKWQELGENIKIGISDKWKEFQDWWVNTAIVQWWNENVSPWFTKEKWQQIADDAKTGVENKFDDWKNNFKPIEDWWNNKVKPWFTWDKWQQVADDAKSGIESKFNDWKNNFHPVSDWWSNNIAPWFTWDKWRQLGQDAVQAVQDAFSNFELNIKLPHFSWDKNGIQAPNWAKGVLEALNFPTTLPKLSVSWYANGGMPDMGEIFVARERGPEMVGRIGNKTSVANNDQIVTAIKQGVYEAVTSAMSNGSSEVHLDIRTEEGVIVKKVSQGFKNYVMQTGELPFPIPV